MSRWIALAPSPRDTFTSYVDALDEAGYITKSLKPVIDLVRSRGTVANHKLPPSSAPDSLATLRITGHLLEALYEMPGMVPADPPELPPAPG
jgi:hypothetical protein